MTILDELVEKFNKENQKSDMNYSQEQYVDLSEQYPKEEGVLVLPDYIHVNFFSGILLLLRNWEVGKENENLYLELSQRTEAIIQNSSRMPDDFGLGLQRLVLNIAQQDGEEMFERMAKYGNYDVETLREITTHTYELRNNNAKMFRTLKRIEQEVTGNRKKRDSVS